MRLYTGIPAIKDAPDTGARLDLQTEADALLADAGVLEIPDIPYTEQAHERQRLDLWVPSGTAHLYHPRPLLVWFHGGSWERGSRAFGPARGAVADGYIVANVSYRFSSDAVFPAQLEDCKAAIRWLRANADRHGIDPDRIGVWGGSAGAHLASLLGVTSHTRAFDRGGNLAESSSVKCVVDWFAPSDFLNYGEPHWAPLDHEETAISRLLGATPGQEREKARVASPVYHVTPSAAPFLIMHGTADPLVPLQQSQVLNERLKEAGVESTLRVIPGGTHGGPEFNTPEVLAEIAAFFRRHLMPFLG